MLCARSELGLESVLDQIRKRGGSAVYKICDTSVYEQMKELANFAIQTYGRIDTWINNASTAVFAKIEETTSEEFKRVMEVNFLGYVHGSLVSTSEFRLNSSSSLGCPSSSQIKWWFTHLRNISPCPCNHPLPWCLHSL